MLQVFVKRSPIRGANETKTTYYALSEQSPVSDVIKTLDESEVNKEIKSVPSRVSDPLGQYPPLYDLLIQFYASFSFTGSYSFCIYLHKNSDN